MNSSFVNDLRELGAKRQLEVKEYHAKTPSRKINVNTTSRSKYSLRLLRLCVRILYRASRELVEKCRHKVTKEWENFVFLFLILCDLVSLWQSVGFRPRF
jgi:hypothetical protein